MRGIVIMNRATMRQKSVGELEAIISESEALIKRTEEEIGWAKEIISKKADEIELFDFILFCMIDEDNLN